MSPVPVRSPQCAVPSAQCSVPARKSKRSSSIYAQTIARYTRLGSSAERRKFVLSASILSPLHLSTSLDPVTFTSCLLRLEITSIWAHTALHPPAQNMDVPPITSSTNSVASRFVSSDALAAARQQRELEWKAAYERLGQEPPKQPDESTEPYDGRSLWEKLNEQKVGHSARCGRQLAIPVCLSFFTDDKPAQMHEEHTVHCGLGRSSLVHGTGVRGAVHPESRPAHLESSLRLWLNRGNRGNRGELLSPQQRLACETRELIRLTIECPPRTLRRPRSKNNSRKL